MSRHRSRITVVALALTVALLAALAAAAVAGAEGDKPTPDMPGLNLPPGGTLPEGGVVVGNRILFPDGTGVVLAPAGYSDCGSGTFCLWMGQDFTGAMIYTGPRTSWYNIQLYPNDAESARNNSARYGQVATEQNGAGSRQCHNPGGHFNSLGSVFNNNVESYVLWDSGGCR